MIKFAFGATVVKFLYKEDILDQKYNYLRHWEFHSGAYLSEAHDRISFWSFTNRVPIWGGHYGQNIILDTRNFTQKHRHWKHR